MTAAGTAASSGHPASAATGSASTSSASAGGATQSNSSASQSVSPSSSATSSSSTVQPVTSAKKPSTTSVPPLPRNTVVPPSFDALAVKGLVLPASQPVSISIPAIKVSSSLLDLGLLPDGTIQVPPVDDPHGKAGWYKGSPTPGALGPSIILGHVDSAKYGPSVFYSLGSLKPGDQISVTRQDGTVAVFKVDAVRSNSKTAFPTQQVYGNLDYAGLRLITCGGTFDPSSGHYQSNIIAYASLVSSHKA